MSHSESSSEGSESGGFSKAPQPEVPLRHPIWGTEMEGLSLGPFHGVRWVLVSAQVSLWTNASPNGQLMAFGDRSR